MDLLVQISSMVGVGITILVQTVTIIWFMAKLAFRVNALEKAVGDMEQTHMKDNFPVRFAKVELLLELIQRQQDEQALKMDKVVSLISNSRTPVRRKPADGDP